MWTIVLWILLGYFVFRFVFNFLLPVFRVGRQMRRQVRDFQQHMYEAQGQQFKQSSQADDSVPPRKPSPSEEKAGDYIDFEEIK